MKGTKKIDWTEEDEEDREKKVIKTLEVKDVREKEINDGGKPAIQKDIYIIRKTLLPVRRAVKQRKEWAKFGEVKEFRRGEHRPGDYAKENEVNIQIAGEEQGEIGIVSQLENMTTQGMREKQLERKKKDLEGSTTTAADAKPKAKSKLEDAFSKAQMASGDVSLRVNDIFPLDASKTEEELRAFFDEIWLTNSLKCVRSRFIFSKDSRRQFLNKAYFTFADQKQTAKAYAALDGEVYNSVSLSCEIVDDNQRRGPR
mmetsp:Transcript_18748/g.21543  ORF Transcript_18748/g.21543 Transcript_18748/m.21543 type:complete len:257 (+) Transcript_18748:43-813(+)